MTIELPRVETFTLACGLEVRVVTRAEATTSHVALLGSPGAVTRHPRVAILRLLARVMSRALEAEVSIGRSGFFVTRDVPGGDAVRFAIEALAAAEHAGLTPRALFEVKAELEHERVVLGRVMNESRARRLFGANSLEWSLAERSREVPEPSVDSLRETLREQLAPARTRLVIVGPEATAAVRDALEAALADAPVASNEVPPHLASESPRVLAPSPQLHAFETVPSSTRVRMTAIGPSSFDADAPAFELVFALLTDARASRLRRTLDVARGFDDFSRLRPAVGHSVATVEFPVNPSDLAPSIEISMSELDRLTHADRIDPNELAIARHAAMTRERTRFDEGSALARAVHEAAASDLELEAYAARFEAMRRVTAEDVAAVVQRHLAPERVAFDVANDVETLSHLPTLPGGQRISRRLP
ncbi:MAG: insulinase family protein [Deltaproteobacteria bacterium]|nr:insulinase family protein [Deltaproteobacteria bacterium]